MHCSSASFFTSMARIRGPGHATFQTIRRMSSGNSENSLNVVLAFDAVVRSHGVSSFLREGVAGMIPIITVVTHFIQRTIAPQ